MKHPLAVLLMVVVTIVGILLTLPDATARTYVDPPMLTLIIIGYIAALVVMIRTTQPGAWTFLGAGLLATILGDALLYLYIVLPAFGVEERYEHVYLSIVRALLMAGGPFLVVGLIRESRHDDHPPATPEPDP